ncbi:MAG: peptidylprolyl isomerase [Elusimicrobiales bacterium]|nr:peptidylprolyl isomerase [Elusimicrobiales bacterium]NLH39758.1 hypothetical protein [Elusimicrobiota bacterium]
MKNINKIFFIFFLSMPLYSEVKEDVVAKVNGEAIFNSDINSSKQAILSQYLELAPDILKQQGSEDKINKMAFDKAVSELLIKQEATKLGIKVSEREIDNGISEVKNRFSVDKEGNKISQKDAEALFLDELKKQNISYDDFRERVKKDLMARKLIDQVIRPKVKSPSDDDVKKFYDNIIAIINNSTSSLKLSSEEMDDYTNIANKLKDMFAERIRIRHILIKSKGDDLVSKNQALEKANGIRKQLLSGADFEDIAAKESDDIESSKHGGDIGYVVKGMLPESLDKVAFSIAPGEISDVIQTDFGYHIIQVTEKRIAQKIKFEMVKDDLANIMMQQSFAKELDKYIDDLKKTAKIVVFDQKFKQ